MSQQPVDNFTVAIILNSKPIDCFFTLDGSNWCPGWVVANVELPLSVHSNMFYLVYDFGGDLHWVQANKLKFRGECPNFEYAYFKTFNWQKWQQFPTVNSYLVSKPENK
jgi:hypothetical protein